MKCPLEFIIVFELCSSTLLSYLRETHKCRLQMKGCFRVMLLFPVPSDLWFFIPSWRGTNRKKWWSFSLHATVSNSMQTFLITFICIVQVFTENKSSRPGQLLLLTSAKQKRASCSVLTLLLVDWTYLLWYIHLSYLPTWNFLNSKIWLISTRFIKSSPLVLSIKLDNLI